MNKKLKPFGRFFVSGLVSVFILSSLTFVSSTLPIQASAESTPVVTSTVSPTHSSLGSKIGDFFKSIFGGKDKAVTPVVTTPIPINTPTPQVVNTPPTIIQQITQAGLTGNTGPQGLRGFTGLQGLKGDKGESGVNIDTSSLVTKSFFDRQVDGIFNSMSKNIQGLSDSLNKEINTKLLTVTGDATIGGNILLTGTILGSNLSGSTSGLNTGDNAINSLYSGLAVSKQDALNGTGFVKISGTTISYDNSTYITSLSGAVLTSQSTPQTIGLTDFRLSKLWATDLDVTNTITGSISGNAGTVTNGAYLNTANTFTNPAPMTTLAESWIGPSSANGIYFKGGNVGVGNTNPTNKFSIVSGSNKFSSPHQVYLMGDSLTGVSVHYGTQLATDLGSSWHVNWKGISGNTTTQMLARFNTDIITPGNAEYVVVWGGVNDIAGGVSATTIESNLQAMYDMAHNAGIKVVAVNITPFCGDAGWSSCGATAQATQDAVNSWIANTARNIDYKVDAYSVFVNPSVPYTLLSTYDDGGHLHFSSTGYTFAGTTIYNAVTWSPAIGNAMDITGDSMFSGKIGIGVNALSGLDVNGGIAVGGYAGLNTAPASGMIISGNVGIGTANPVYKLDVSGAINATSVLVNGVAVGAGSQWTSGSGGIISYISGNVGIGTATPGAKLTIENAIASSGAVTTPGGFLDLYLNDDTEVAGEGATIVFSSDYNSGASKTIRGAIRGGTEIIGANTAGFLAFYTNNDVPSNNAPERMRITSTGNVGIGITSPSNILHVTGTPVAGTATARIANTLNGTTQNNGLLILAGNDTGVATSELITFKRPDNTTMGTITQTGAGAIAFNSGSDRRIKDTESIKPTIYGLSDLLNIKVDDFTFISDPSKQKNIGFIAQELYSIYPNAVTTNGDNGTDTLTIGATPWMVDYSKLTPLLVKSVQELDLKVEGINNIETENSLRSVLIAWFGNVANGIQKLYTKEINAHDANINNLCITDDSGEKVCITKQELLQIKTSAGIGATNSGSGSSGNTDNTDVCPNIDGVQTVIPSGDEINADGQCVKIIGEDTGGTGDSKKTLDIIAPIITLSGDNPITLKVGDAYTEAGATATDDVDTTVNVDISGTVDTTIAGTYTIKYNAKDAAGNTATEVTRTVTVE